jgi:hypothetical protein
MSDMRRREFITLLGGAAAAWPRGVLAQVLTRRPLIAVLSAQSSASASRLVTGFAQRPQELGYVASRDVDIAYGHYLGVSEVTYYRWRQEFGGLKTVIETSVAIISDNLVCAVDAFSMLLLVASGSSISV